MRAKPQTSNQGDGETMKIKLPLHICNKGYEKKKKKNFQPKDMVFVQI
jgi:hypothetical protein